MVNVVEGLVRWRKRLRGKELLSRIVVGFFFGAIFIFASISHPLVLLLFLLVWLGITSQEFLNLLRKMGFNLPPIFFIPLNLVFILLIYLKVPIFYFSFLIFLTFFWSLCQSPFSSKNLSYPLFFFFYLGYLPSHFLSLKRLVFENQLSNYILLFPIFFTWLNDTLAYGIGRWLGKKKLAEGISPKKTWEGFLGGLFLSLPFSIIYLKMFFPNIPLFSFIGLSILLSIAAQLGDLVESVFKREAGVKDSSSLLSGHGGFLDRVDSLLFTIPVFYQFLRIYIK